MRALVMAALSAAGIVGAMGDASANPSDSANARNVVQKHPDAQAHIKVPEHQYQLSGLETWRPMPEPSAKTPAPNAPPESNASASTAKDRGASVRLAGYWHDRSNARLAIARMNYPNLGAWRRDKAFFAQVEAGLSETSPGFKRLYQNQMRIGKVPALDVTFRRKTNDGTEVVLMRFLFFRRYTLALTLSMPKRAYRRYRRTHRKLIENFVPYFGS